MKEFFLWHGEKFAVGLVGLIAFWLIIQGLGYLGSSAPWPPEELQRIADIAENDIKNNEHAPIAEGVIRVDFADTATQITEPIPATPYRAIVPWNPEMKWRSP